MKNGGHARAAEARAPLDMALELTKRSCKPEEYDEQLVAYVEGSYFSPLLSLLRKKVHCDAKMTGNERK